MCQLSHEKWRVFGKNGYETWRRARSKKHDNTTFIQVESQFSLNMLATSNQALQRQEAVNWQLRVIVGLNPAKFEVEKPK